ncbi:TetR/AcrR family transcriptional regulator (plasmid) [Novosphingobium sp. BL-8A]|uniref:TetR/AcrR family transcriptional regulator n=1 Tax=Novosphingobium sp. BL-8A TaxID=3127639 RepID=UPI003756D963
MDKVGHTMTAGNPSADKPGSEPRRRAALTKRTRTRAQILEAVLAAYPGADPFAPVTVDDVLRVAGLSRATFYKYFTSLEEAVEQLGSRLADELADAYAAMYGDVVDPKVRAATGFQLFLTRAAMEPNWGSFVSHAHYLSRDEGLLRQIKSDLQAGIATGDFKIAELDVAVDFIVGVKTQAIRRLVQSSASQSYIQTITSMILRSLGLCAQVADTATLEAAYKLASAGPDRLSWWRP